MAEKRLDMRAITHYQRFSYPSGVTVDLYKGPGVITTEVILYLVANITTTGGTLKEDTLARLLKSFKINAGSTNFVNFQDGRQLVMWAGTRLKGNVRMDTLPTSGTATVYGVIPVHFGIRPYDDKGNYNAYDLTSVIPEDGRRTRITSLQASMEWGTPSDLGTEVTINSASIQVQQKYILMSEEEMEKYYGKGIPTTRLEVSIEELSRITTNRGARYDLPSSTFVNTTILMTTDSEDRRSEEEISEIGIEFTLSSTSILNVPYILAQEETRRVQQLPIAQKGVIAIDWGRQVPGSTPEIGFSTHKKEKGEVQIGATIAKTGGKLHKIDHCINMVG